MSSVRVGVVGIGGTGRVHSQMYGAHAGAELAAACALPEHEPEKFAKEMGIPKVYTDYRELAADKTIDAVSVCTPTALHCPMAKRLLEAGKHVLVEKPIAVNAGECEEMIAAAKRHNCKLQVGNMWRFHPAVEFVRSAVEQGTIGRVVKAKSYGVHVHWGPGRWFIKKELAGGGMLMDMGIHAINTMRCLMGDPGATTVWARIDTIYGEYDVDDFGVLTIEFDNGAVGIVETGMWHPHADGDEASTQLFGTAGYARVFPTEVKYRIGRTWGTYTPEIVDDRGYPTPIEHISMIMHERQIDHFVTCITEDTEPMTSAHVALEDMKIIDAAYASSQAGQQIRIA